MQNVVSLVTIFDCIDDWLHIFNCFDFLSRSCVVNRSCVYFLNASTTTACLRVNALWQMVGMDMLKWFILLRL
jgi:hypothetical protein